MAWSIRLRDAEACDPETPFLSPDLLITQNWGPQLAFDMKPAERDETMNRGGLASKRGMHTAVALCLFCDARLPEGVAPLDDRDPDPRGWWGDTVDINASAGEGPIGSLLWTLRRAILNQETLNQETLALAEQYSRAALQCLISQGGIVRLDVSCSGIRLPQVDPTAGALAIDIAGYGRDGTKYYNTRFEALWSQIETLRREGIS